jgi:hypothetical protein
MRCGALDAALIERATQIREGYLTNILVGEE